MAEDLREGKQLSSGKTAGVTPSRLRRLEGALSFQDLRKELENAVTDLIEMAELDIDSHGRVFQRETTIELVLNDEYALTTVIEDRAADFKSFFEQYVARVKCYDEAPQLDIEVAIRCMQVAYKVLLVRLEMEPAVHETIYLAWRGILELS